jgi:hypothetical protein
LGPHGKAGPAAGTPRPLNLFVDTHGKPFAKPEGFDGTPKKGSSRFLN